MFGTRGAKVALVAAMTYGVTVCDRTLADEHVAFDTEVLKDRGIDPKLAQYFSLAPRFEQGLRRIALEVNGVAKGRALGRFNEHGDLCVDTGLLAGGGVRVPASLSRESGKGACVLFSTAFPEAIARLDPGKEQVSLLVPTHLLATPGPGQRSFSKGGVAGLFNYDALAVSSQFNGQSSQYHSLNSEVGLNAGDWVFRSRQSYASFQGVTRFEHLNAYAERTLESYKTQMQLGQLTLATPLFAGGAFTGVQFLPESALALESEGFGAGSAIEGIAYSPARVEVRQNGAMIYTTVVPPGPFTLRDLPLLSYNLDLDVTVYEEKGSRRRFTVPSASLRGGTGSSNASYSSAFGQVRRITGDNRQTPTFAMLSNDWQWRPGTQLSVGVMGANDYQSLGWGVHQALTDHTTVSAQQVVSGVLTSKTRGAQFQAALSTVLAPSLSASLTASQQSEGFRTLSDTAWNQTLDRPESRASQQLGASLSGRTQQSGTFGAVLSRNATVNGEAQLRLGLSWSRAFGEVSLSANLERSFGGQANNASGNGAYLSLSMPLGAQRSLSTYARRDDRAGLSSGAQLSEHVSDTLAYSIAADRDENGATGINGRVNLLPRYTRAGLGYSHSGSGSKTYDVALRGGLAVHADGVTPSPYPLRDTFGLVKVGESPGVKIRTSQGPVWTDGAGRAVAASLPAYRNTKVEIETTSLPRSVDVLNGYQEVEAGRGSVQVFDFALVSARRVLLVVHTAQGQPVAKGVAVYAGEKYLTTVVDAGKIFLLDAQSEMQLQLALSEGNTCNVTLKLAQTPSESSVLFETAEAVCESG
ncbi:fimbria/pilus outer membrane usher protein [Pseudomonas sp. Ma2-10]